jgi:hypothetical protein
MISIVDWSEESVRHNGLQRTPNVSLHPRALLLRASACQRLILFTT